MDKLQSDRTEMLYWIQEERKIKAINAETRRRLLPPLPSFYWHKFCISRLSIPDCTCRSQVTKRSFIKFDGELWTLEKLIRVAERSVQLRISYTGPLRLIWHSFTNSHLLIILVFFLRHSVWCYQNHSDLSAGGDHWTNTTAYLPKTGSYDCMLPSQDEQTMEKHLLRTCKD